MDENETPEFQALPTAEELAAMTPEALGEIADAAVEEFQGYQGRADDLTDAEVDRIEALASFVELVSAEETNREQAAADRRARVDAAAARIQGQDGGDGDEDGDDDGEEGDPAPVEEDPAPAETPAAPQQVAASARPVRSGLVRRARRPANPAPREDGDRGGITILASADVNGFSAGQQLSTLRDVAVAFMNRSKSFPQGRASRSQRLQYGVASFQRNFGSVPVLNEGASLEEQMAAIERAGDHTRLPGGSLLAAGGWCAPSETLYTLPPLRATLAGIIDVPELGVSRGGVRHTLGPDWSDIYTNSGFYQTEAEAIAGDTKDCFDVECPDFTDVRLAVAGVCINAPILTRSGYPEAVQNWIEGSLVANQHKVAAKVLQAIQTYLGSLVTALSSGAVSHSTVTALELLALGMRYKWRLSDTEVMEVKAPLWLKTAIRADLAARNGIGLEAVSDARIQAHFAASYLSVQWIYNLDDGDIVGDVDGCVTDFPDTAEVLIYPAGTFVKGTQDVISLDTVYDSTNLALNTYVATFVEDGWLVLRRGYGGCRATIPVAVTGKTGPLTLATFGVTDA